MFRRCSSLLLWPVSIAFYSFFSFSSAFYFLFHLLLLRSSFIFPLEVGHASTVSMATKNCVSLWKIIETRGQTEWGRWKSVKRKIKLKYAERFLLHAPLMYKHDSNKHKPIDTTHYFEDTLRRLFIYKFSTSNKKIS